MGRGFADDLIAALRAQPGVAGVDQKQDRLVATVTDGAAVPALVGLLVRGGAEVEEVRQDRASLEEVFLALMEEK